MSLTEPLISPMACSHLLEMPPFSADTRSFPEQVAPVAFLKPFIVSLKSVPSSDWAKPSHRAVTVILLCLLRRKCPSLYQHCLRVRRSSLLLAEHLLLSPEEKA